jgi:hypothetical protein
MSLTIRFSFDSQGEKDAFEEYARKRGLKLPALAKMALYQYRVKNPLKRVRNGELMGLCEKEDSVQNNPAALKPTGSGDGICDKN